MEGTYVEQINKYHKSLRVDIAVMKHYDKKQLGLESVYFPHSSI